MSLFGIIAQRTYETNMATNIDDKYVVVVVVVTLFKHGKFINLLW